MSFQNRSAALAAVCFINSMVFGGSQQTAEPKIEFTEIPPADCGGPTNSETIAGRITGVASKQYRLVIYAQACNSVLYVQPTVADPFTNLEADGKFDAYIHLGQMYYVLLVEPGFKPKPEITKIPEKGEGIVAVFRVRGSKR